VIVVAALVICLVPAHEIPGVFEVSDKFAHLAGHAALAIYFAGLVPRPRWWKIFALLLVFGVAVELAQFTMHVGRNGDPRDVFANGAGAAFGLLLARLGLQRWPEFVERLWGQRRTAQ
jgi:glycopeptide antibiotics resistance protein